MLTKTVNWDKLARIRELEEYFKEDFDGYKALIEEKIEEFEHFSDEALDKFAKLRVLEVTNGCTQWAFRRGDKECLSVEKTRECMNMVMGFIKQAKLYFPSEGKIEFDEEQKAFLEKGRNLYINAFKKHNEESEREYYAASTAQFIVYGVERMHRAFDIVKQDYESLFSPYYIQRGQRYIAPYLACLETEDN